MLLIETDLRPSIGKGLGMFARHIILEGTLYWVRSEVFDKIITPDDMLSLNDLAVNYIKRYGCLETNNNWYLCADNARFCNHSDHPNTRIQFDKNGLIQSYVASRFIDAGEEIFCDYKEICQTCIHGVIFQ